MARAKAVGKAFSLSGHWFVAPPRVTELEKVKSSWQMSFSGQWLHPNWDVCLCTVLRLFSLSSFACQTANYWGATIVVCQCYWLLLFILDVLLSNYFIVLKRTVQSSKTLAWCCCLLALALHLEYAQAQIELSLCRNICFVERSACTEFSLQSFFSPSSLIQ